MTENGHHDEPNRGGAPEGNRNRLKHGWRSVHVGALPPPYSYITRQTREFRNRQESLAREHLGLADDALLPDLFERRIQLAALWEQRGLLAQRVLREDRDKLDPAGVVQMATYAADSRERRDNALRSLGMDNATPTLPEDELTGPAALYGEGA